MSPLLPSAAELAADWDEALARILDHIQECKRLDREHTREAKLALARLLNTPEIKRLVAPAEVAFGARVRVPVNTFNHQE